MKHWKFVVGIAFIVFGGLYYLWSLFQPAPVPPAPEAVNEKPVVAASFYPLAYVLQRVAGNGYTVRSVAPGGVEPHDFEPSPQDVLMLQKASIFFYNGAGIDSWVDRIMPALRETSVESVNTSVRLAEKGYSLLAAAEEDHVDEAEEDHEEFLYDPHVWLDPKAMALLGEIMSESLAARFPADAEVFRENAKAWATDTTQLDQEFTEGLASCTIKEIIVSHNAFSYLGRRYNFSITPIAGFSPQVQPSAKRLGELAGIAKSRGIKVIFFETLVSPKLSEALAREVGASVDVLDPIEGVDPAAAATGSTYLTIMRENLSALKRAMDCSAQ